jgi:glucan phosphoethanolaminetransferase (alkaline phosphatase superfamily)
MSEPSTAARPARPAASQASRTAVYAAAAWALVFAAMSFYWAAGGSIGSSTMSDTIVEPARAREPQFVALLWITGVLKAIAGLLALALVRPQGRVLPRWIPLTATWVAGVGMLLYGGANLAVRAVMALGLLATPESMHSAAARWHLLLWDPWWVLGGALFVVAAWSCGRRRHPGVVA